MGTNKSISSKAIVKQKTTGDIPQQFSAYPVLASYGPVESTLNQTVINLGFSVDTVNNPDSLLLFIDGKTMSRGALYDYTFTSIDMNGFSSQVTMTYPLPATINIYAIKLGLKKETEFAQDSRFNNLYDAFGSGFKSFVATNQIMNPTATIGAPANGFFYSEIVNRAPVVDFNRDLSCRLGPDFRPVNQISEVLNEFAGSTGRVFKPANDPFDQVRLVGSWTNVLSNTSGAHVSTSTSGDFIEIVFWGTGLDIAVIPLSPADLRARVDGGSEGANIFAASPTAPLAARNYNANNLVPVASGLAAGVHTVRIRANSAGNFLFQGYRVHVGGSSLLTSQGDAYRNGLKASSLASSSSFNSSFESGTLGTRGGRVVVYQKSDGTIAKAVNPTNASALLLSAADHTNEDVARVYNWREFGAGRADDLSLLTGAVASDRFFTLEDNSTMVVASGVGGSIAAVTDAMVLQNNGGYIQIHFVGTGLDIIQQDSAAGGADNYTYQIDGGVAATFATSGNITPRVVRVVSGLPYGSHVVRINRVTAATFSLAIQRFIVYQPKKPAIPSGAVEIADYNILADYVANASASLDTIATGVLRKTSHREFYHNGTWSTTNNFAQCIGALQAFTAATGSTTSYVFWGTGFEIRPFTNGTVDFTININGSTNLSSFGTGVYGTGISIVPATGTVSITALNVGCGTRVTGLPFAQHTVTFTRTGGTGNMAIAVMDIIQPIHSHNENDYLDYYNTSPASKALKDSRSLTPVKDLGAQVPNVSKAVGVSSTATTTSTVFVPLVDMSLTHVSKTGRVKISFSGTFQNSVANIAVEVQPYVNNAPAGIIKRATQSNTGDVTITGTDIVSVPLGPNKIDMYWRTVSNTAISVTNFRSIIVEDI